VSEVGASWQGRVMLSAEAMRLALRVQVAGMDGARMTLTSRERQMLFRARQVVERLGFPPIVSDERVLELLLELKN